MEKLYEIKLPFNLLTDLDGKVDENAQKVIDTAKEENEIGFELPIMNEILRKAIEKGKLTWTYKQINSCSYCDKKRDYYRYPRNGKYHNKGDKNLDKPKYYSGIKFNEGFITMQGQGDMCRECCDSYNVIEQLVNYILDNDVKVEIQKNDYGVSRYLKDDTKVCYQCEQEIRESEMTSRDAIMGGKYPSGCPHCGAESLALGRSHKNINKFDFIFNPVALDEIGEIRSKVDEVNESLEDKDKLKLTQGKYKIHLFFVEHQDRQRNMQLAIDTKNKKYYLSKYLKQGERFEQYLSGYEKTEDQFFYM